MDAPTQKNTFDGPLGTSNSKRIRPSGGYRRLRSFQAATVIYDATVSFCARFLDQRSRTVDQMVQAARSGRQNITEGSRASATSTQTELRLVNVARASLDELLLDYEDFLRQRGLALWKKEDPKAKEIRRVAYNSDKSYVSYKSYFEVDVPEIAANAGICLIHQANYLLDRQLRQLDKEFLEQGGFTEKLHRMRTQHRQTEKETIR